MADVIQEFLIGLGFKIDPAQQNRFTDSLKASHTQIQAVGQGMTNVLNQFASLATAATGAGIGLAAALTQIGREMGQLGFAAQRIGSDPGNIRAFEFAMKQMGGTAEEARSSLEAVASAQRLMPGLLETFGVKEGTDTVAAFLQLGERWQGMIARGAAGMSQARQEAEALHISEQTMMRLARPETRQFYGAEVGAQARTGLSIKAITDIGIETTRQTNQLRQTFDNFGLFLEQDWGPRFNRALSGINDWFKEHTPEITRYLHGTQKDFDDFTTAISNWYSSLTPATQGTIEKTGLFLAGTLAITQVGSLLGLVGRVVGLGSLAGPIGQLAALGGGIVLLANDYQRWIATGGKESLIDWTAWSPGIESAKEALIGIKNLLTPVIDATIGWQGAQSNLIAFMATYLLPGVLGPLARILEIASLIKSAFEAASSAVEKLIFGAERAQQAERLKSLGPAPSQNQLDWAMKGLPGPMPAPDADQGGVGGWWNQSWWGRNMPTWMGGAGGPAGGPPFTGTGGGGGGGGGGATDQRKADVRDKLSRDLGISRDAAAGLVSNLNAESGIAGINERNPVVPGSRGGFGWAQWTGPRRLEFEAYAARNKLDPASDEANYGFLIEELRTKYPNVLAQLKGGGISAAEAAKIVADKYIIPPEATKPGHIAAAESIAKLTGAVRPAATGAGDITTTAPNLGGAALTPSPISYNQQDQSKQVSVNAPNTVTINGVSDPERAATLVDRSSERQQANLMRHLQTVYA